MAHTNDLNAARKSAEEITDPYERTLAQAEVAKASALTDIAAAVDDASNTYYKANR